MQVRILPRGLLEVPCRGCVTRATPRKLQPPAFTQFRDNGCYMCRRPRARRRVFAWAWHVCVCVCVCVSESLANANSNHDSYIYIFALALRPTYLQPVGLSFAFMGALARNLTESVGWLRCRHGCQFTEKRLCPADTHKLYI